MLEAAAEREAAQVAYQEAQERLKLGACSFHMVFI